MIPPKGPPSGSFARSVMLSTFLCYTVQSILLHDFLLYLVCLLPNDGQAFEEGIKEWYP